MELSFSIDSWSAWSSDKDSFTGKVNGVAGDVAETLPPCHSLIPASKRRKMSTLSKTAVSIALDCLNKYKGLSNSDVTENPICVFASRHGELVRSTKIIESMLDGEDISPTDFSMSVHSTALGLFSILTENKDFTTSIAGGEDSFVYGLIEACMQLAEKPIRKVLLVYFDEPLPNALSKFEKTHSKSICISLLISVARKGSPYYMFRAIDSNARVKKNEYNDVGEMFLNFYLSEDKSLSVRKATTPSSIWNWQREC